MTIYNVSEINTYIKELFSTDNNLRKVMIRGEISNFKFHSSGHCYLTLKDEHAALRAVIFRRFAQKLRFRPENGMKVIACGSISVYDRDGTYQLYIEQLVPDGIGDLNLYYEQLKNKLTLEGLFNPEHKRSLPIYPKTIGIITSKTGAVLHDIYNVASQRNPAVKLLLYPVMVQGDGSAEQIVKALQYFDCHYDLCDVLIIGRGGGSMEDLWSFNDERVVRAVYAAKLPIVSAVGHETDYTLTDFASDVRASTPSHAAQLCVPSREELLKKIYLLQTNLSNVIENYLASCHTRLNNCRNNKLFNDTYSPLGDSWQQLDLLISQLNNAVNHQFTDKQHIITVLSEKLALLNPETALQRGYSMVYRGNTVITSTDQLAKNDLLQIVLSDGQVSATVNALKKKGEHYAKKETNI
ncbi:exodeoxyribonuclease VII large subunit [Pectinatus frisingensis]|uniref:exodeoxyribonuclease VII large subunit n=1 Tax=Pectinatus frisingensis TaxID=865 RepID=UPI0018C5098C|nr:exodeoxyribonuclease VII large subunit [Pectinatus frisingensis]